MTTFIYGSGMTGCLYDSGFGSANTLDEAIGCLLERFSDLEGGELEDMANELRQFGYYRFNNASEAGAQCCEVVKHETNSSINK